jgi:CheY-like chemotaxis protein
MQSYISTCWEAGKRIPKNKSKSGGAGMTKRNILLVDDNFAEIRVLNELVNQSELECNLHVAVDGLDAMDFLLQRGKHVTVPRPDLILLDLNLPKKDGRQVLKEIKEHPRLRQIPVLIQTYSNAQEDVFASYDSYANGVLVKAGSIEAMAVQLRRIEEFWFQASRLPKEKQPAAIRKLHHETFEEERKEKNDERTGTH